MDPQATIERYRAALAAGRLCEASEARDDLRAWIRGGGFEPSWRNRDERRDILASGRACV